MENVKQYSKFLVLSYLIAIVLLCLTGVIFAYTNINDSLINTFVFVIIAITNLVGSCLLSRKIRKKGYILGAIFGLIYFVLIYLMAVIFYTGFFVNELVGIYLLLCVLAGIVGGIIGVNVR